MSVIREPFVDIDLQVQYSDVDIRPQSEVPIVGAVVRSDYYCEYYYSLSERQRMIERRAIEIQTKREYMNKIVRGNFILPEDHLSLKNGYYMSGTVRCFFAPEIGKPNHSSIFRGSNIKQAITIVNYEMRRKDNSVIPNHYLFSSLVITDKETNQVHLYHTAPAFHGTLNSPSINFANGILRINGANIYYFGLEQNIERIKYVFSFEIIPDFGLCDNSAGNSYLVISENYAVLMLAQSSGDYNVYVYARHAPESAEMTSWLISLQNAELKFYTDNNPVDLIPDGPIVTVILNNSSITDFLNFINNAGPPDYYYYAPYITAHYSSIAGYYDYGGFYGFVVSGITSYDVEAISGTYVNGNWIFTLHDGYTAHSYTIGNCNTIPRSDVLIHEVNITNTPSSCIFTVPGSSNVTFNFASIIARITNVSKYKIGYNYDINTFLDALELLDMVDIIVDNGYTYKRTEYNMYADVIATHAHRTTNDKPPALAAITLPVNTNVSSAQNIISLPAQSSTFLCTNYFKTEALGYPVMLPSSTLYVQRIAALYVISNAFAPIFNQPLIDIRPIDRIYNEREREMLLDKRINSLKTYQNTWVFNNNLTATLDNSIFKEENIRRLANVVARECVRILKRFIGKQNVEKTRNEVIAAINRMKQEVIDIHQYKPDEFLIICDGTNNRDYDRYLYVTIVIRMPLSTKYIELVTVAMDLNESA